MFWDLNKQTGITKLEKGLPDKVAIYLWGQWIMKAKCTKHISTKVSKQPQKLKSIYKNVIDWTKNPFSFVLPHKHSSMTAGPFLKKLKKKKNKHGPDWYSSVDWTWIANQRVAGSIPNQGTTGASSPVGACERQPHADISLPLFFPPFLSL